MKIAAGTARIGWGGDRNPLRLRQFSQIRSWHGPCPSMWRDMRELDYPDRHYVNAALGWLELGRPAEAKAEADQVSWLNRVHPEVFQVRWRIHSGLENWEAAHDLGFLFARAFPQRPTGWLCLTYSLYRLKRPLEAFLILLHQVKFFPNVRAIPYFLACYCWEMGDLREAGKWLARFRGLGRRQRIKSAPLDHSQLLMSCESVSVTPTPAILSEPSDHRQPVPFF